MWANQILLLPGDAEQLNACDLEFCRRHKKSLLFYMLSRQTKGVLRSQVDFASHFLIH